MPARLANVTFDCNDALLLAKFWADVLGRQVDQGSDWDSPPSGVAILSDQMPLGTSRKSRSRR